MAETEDNDELLGENPPLPALPRQGKRIKRLAEKVYDGYSYFYNGSYKESTYLICKHSNTGTCMARAILKGGVFTFGKKNHTCADPDPTLKPREIFHNALKQGMSGNHRKAATVYADESEKHDEAAILVPFLKKQRSMERWKGNGRPPIVGSRTPKSLEELDEFYKNNPEQLKYSRGSLTSQLIVVSEKEKALVLWNESFATDCSIASTLNIDATFKVVPRLVENKKEARNYQLLTVLAGIDDHAFPIVFVLMSAKTTALYNAVFKVIFVPFEHFAGNVMSDFEMSMRNALQAALPDADLLGCLFHYSQALQKNAKKHGVLQRGKTDKTVQQIMRSMVALALLPSNMIASAFTEIRRKTGPALAEDMKSFYTYFEEYWIKTRGPSEFCVHGKIHRTNNVVEANNALLSSHLARKPSVLTFTREIIAVMEKTHRDLITVVNGGIVRKRKVRYLVKITQLNAAWANLEAGTYTVDRFLRVAGPLVQKSPKVCESTNSGDDDGTASSSMSDDDVVPRSMSPNTEANTLRSDTERQLPVTIDSSPSTYELGDPDATVTTIRTIPHIVKKVAVPRSQCIALLEHFKMMT